MSNSVRYRLIFSFGATFVRSGFALGASLLLARCLGVTQFGNMSFLLSTFMAFLSLIDMGSSSAFFTFLSQKKQSYQFIMWYFRWMGLECIVVLLVLGFIFPNDWINYLWKGASKGLVLIAFLAVFLQHGLWPIVVRAAESMRQSIRVQTVGLFIVVLYCLALLVLWKMHALTLWTIFEMIVSVYLLAICIMWAGLSEINKSNDEPSDFIQVFRKYISYCLPLIPYTSVGFISQFVDRWMLQTFSGSHEQAYFAISTQFSTIALIATTSILHIFWKEIAEAHFQDNRERVRLFYKKVSRGIFFLGALIAGFLVPWSLELIHLLLGEPYEKGSLALSIMFLYPIHQSLGQIVGSMFYATEKVSIQVTLGIIVMLIGTIATYFVVAPASAIVPGFGLGAEGLAFKMVLLQCISVNIAMYIIARIWQWPFEWAYQLIVLGICLGLGWIVHELAIYGLKNDCAMIGRMLMSGFLFMMLLAITVTLLPGLIGFTREEWTDLLNKMRLRAFLRYT